MRAGIEVRERIPIPDDMIPEDARVEMDAKQAAGYFTVRSQCTVVLRALPAVIVADIFAYIGLCELGWALARCTLVFSTKTSRNSNSTRRQADATKASTNPYHRPMLPQATETAAHARVQQCETKADCR